MLYRVIVEWNCLDIPNSSYMVIASSPEDARTQVIKKLGDMSEEGYKIREVESLNKSGSSND